MDYQKNPEAIFRAFEIVKKTKAGFQLIVISNENELIRQLSKQYSLEENIEQLSEMRQPEMVKELQKADALVLFSRYETFGCVVAEANACGLPVIVSDIPVMHELVTENVNGIFAASDNAEQLAQKILWFMEHKQNFSSRQIASATAEKYNYAKVGKMFSNWYQKISEENISL